VTNLHRCSGITGNSFKECDAMQILRVLTVAMVATFASSQRVSGPETVAVRTVVNGDTIDVAVYGRIKLAGIRAPRAGRNGTEGEPLGREARERLEGMLTHRFVRLEFPSPASRTSAYVLLDDGSFVNAVLVSEGLARASRATGPRGAELLRAQERATSARLGIWRSPD
jgi:micrococcal nuclease